MKTKVKANAKQLHAQVQQEINAGRIVHTPKSPMSHAEREVLADGMFEQKYCVDLDDKSLLQRILLHKNSRLSFRLKV
jgi:hypothetical protein